MVIYGYRLDFNDLPAILPEFLQGSYTSAELLPPDVE